MVVATMAIETCDIMVFIGLGFGQRAKSWVRGSFRAWGKTIIEYRQGKKIFTFMN